MSPSTVPGPKTKLGRTALAMYMVTLFLVVPCLTFTDASNAPQPPRASSIDSTATMPMYLMPSSTLTPASPQGPTDTAASFRASVGITTTDLGTWKTVAAEGPLNIGGKVQIILWAQGQNLQTSTQFTVAIEVNGAQVGTAIQTQSTGLSTPAKEYIGEGTADFNISKGQTISAHITVAERGTGGDLLYGSVSHPSRIILGATPVVTSTFALSHKAGTNVVVRTQLTDVWGVDDVDQVEQFVAGPYETRDMNIDPNSITEDKIVAKAAVSDQAITDKSSGGMNVSWTWVYQGMKSGSSTIKPGIYYLVGKVHCKGPDRTNSRVYSSAGPIVVSEPAQFLGSAGSAVIFAFVIGGLAVLIYFYALRTARFKTDKGRAMAAMLMVAVVVGAGMYAFIVAVPLSAQTGGANAPDFSVTTIDDKGFSLGAQKGKVIVLDMFATWCPTCNAMMPTIVKLHQHYTGAVFISISVEGSGDTVDQIKSFQTKYGADWSFAKDSDNVWQRYHDVSDPNMPTLVIINPQGKISYRHVGEASLDDLSKQVTKASQGGFDLGISTQGQDLVFMAFLIGVFAFFSPCAFPLLPGYMGYVLSRREGTDDPKAASVPLSRSVIGGIVAASGALVLFLLAGVLVAAGSSVLSNVPYLTPIIAIVIIVMGLLMLLNLSDRFMSILSPLTSRLQTRIQGAASGAKGGRASYLGLFLYGLGYGVAAMGCHAPIFIGIMMAGFVAGGFASALLVFIMFGLGMGIMMVTVTVLVGMAKGLVIKRMQSAMPMIQRVSGLILIIAGIYLAWYSLSAIMAVPA